MAGRSRADKEVDQDATQKILIFGGLIFGGVVFVVWSIFSLLGMRLGLWALPVFAPLWIWMFVSAVARQAIRPLVFAELRGKRRLARVGLVFLALWAVWPIWAEPTAAAWHAAHGGLGPFATKPNYPLGAIVAASPIAMGLVAGLLLVFGMLAVPDYEKHEPPRPAPPSGPVPLRSTLMSQLDEYEGRQP